MSNTWALLDCVDGQVSLDDTTYVADGGEYYLINPNHLEQLDAYIDSIEAADVALISSTRINDGGELKEMTEGAYNLAAAAADDRYRPTDSREAGRQDRPCVKPHERH